MMSMKTKNTIPLLIQSSDRNTVIEYVHGMFKNAHIVQTNTEGDLVIEKLRTIARMSSIQQTQPLICIVWGFDTATIQTQNTFLKTLEEQPSNLTYCLVCTNEQQILSTITSRCQSILLKHDTVQEILVDIPLIVRTWTREKPKRTREEGMSFIDNLLLNSTYTISKKPISATSCKSLLSARQSIETFNIDPITALECTVLFK